MIPHYRIAPPKVPRYSIAAPSKARTTESIKDRTEVNDTEEDAPATSLQYDGRHRKKSRKRICRQHKSRHRSRSRANTESNKRLSNEVNQLKLEMHQMRQEMIYAGVLDDPVKTLVSWKRPELRQVEWFMTNSMNTLDGGKRLV